MTHKKFNEKKDFFLFIFIYTKYLEKLHTKNFKITQISHSCLIYLGHNCET